MIGLIIVCTVATISGKLASGGVKKVRHYLNEGETISCKCPRCGNNGPHEFAFLDRSNATDIGVAILFGASGGVVSGMTARKTYKCKHCSGTMYKDGSKTSWNFDKAIKGFLDGGEMGEIVKELQFLLATAKKLSAKQQKDLEKIYRAMEKKEKDVVEIRHMMNSLRQSLPCS